MTIRIAIADDHRLFREALRSILTKDPALTIVGEASTGAETLSLVAEQVPDVLLLDIALTDCSGIQVARKVVVGFPSVKVIALTGYLDKAFIEEMLKSGALGYVSKSASAEDLLRSIRIVAEGQRYLCTEATQAMLRHVQPTGTPSSPPVTILSRREQQVLKLLAEGSRSSEIAEELGISLATVEVYRRNIKAKLDIHSTAELTRYALREGLSSFQV